MKTLTIDELLEEFEDLDDWKDRYSCILELGDELGEMPEELRTEENRVQGCVSRVWLVMQAEAGDSPIIRFMADSDSSLVKGLAAIVVMLCSGRSAKEILAFDLPQVFERLELSKHISRSRSNGLSNMIKRIRALAEKCAG